MMIQRYLFFRLLLVGVVAAAVATRVPLSTNQMDEDHSKYLKFSHTLHVKEQGIACADCHTAAKSSTSSLDDLIGTHESCQSCHEEEISKNCAFCHANADDIVAIPNPPRELRFSHEQHASAQGIEKDFVVAA